MHSSPEEGSETSLEKLVFLIKRVDRNTNKEYFLTKHRKVISKCKHTRLEYYANGMCKNCYHKGGRKKKATGCPHQDKLHYAKGMCKNCYLHRYHKTKRDQREQ